uniref:Uncharacterized protein n=1 Tax=Branchiostoma floridae TaxID=7739 RepID=C3XY82_BRAFL|eukprot:XP_002610757.1 hypothetical protein BRAFLDRAFT_91543 [Branchiostoma floridae]
MTYPGALSVAMILPHGFSHTCGTHLLPDLRQKTDCALFACRSTEEMYEQAEPVRTPSSGPGSRQTSEPPSQPPPVHQGGSHGRVRHGNSADEWQGDQETSTDTYEEAEAVKTDATYTSTSADGTNPGGPSGRRALCSFIRSHRYYLAAGIAVLLGLVAVGLAPLTFINKKEISELSVTFDALKCDLDNISQLSIALKRDLDIQQNMYAALEKRLHEMSKTPGKLE